MHDADDNSFFLFFCVPSYTRLEITVLVGWALNTNN